MATDPQFLNLSVPPPNHHKLFDPTTQRDLRSQNTILSSLSKTNPRLTLTRFKTMVQEGKNIDEYTLSIVLKAAASLKLLSYGKQIQTLVTKSGFSQFMLLVTTLLDLHVKCSDLAAACQIFEEMPERDVVSWTSLIVGHVHQSKHNMALKLFQKMNKGNARGNSYTYSGLLSACSGLMALKPGKQVHAQIIVLGLSDNLTLSNGILGMYGTCRSMYDACRVFNGMPFRGLISWNAMISACVQCECGEEALKLLCLMGSQGIKPDNFSCAICARVCASMASMTHGYQIHALVLKLGFQSDLVIGNSLVDMYAKCGCIELAKLIFEEIPDKDEILWTTMINAYGRHGHVREVLHMFKEMIGVGMKPDGITYMALLSACSHGGLVNQGRHYFKSMFLEHSVRVEPEHYACMVDLLGRNGFLSEAYEFMEEMPIKPCASMWASFLSACNWYGEAQLGEIAAKRLLELDLRNYSDYTVLVSYIKAKAGKWNEIFQTRERTKRKQMKKEPGCSWIEIRHRVDVFLSSDRSHPQAAEMLQALYRLSLSLTEAG
ncbi:hypothetical protein AMTRI_Chr09g18520 [Amborella trichopoda]